MQAKMNSPVSFFKSYRKPTVNTFHNRSENRRNSNIPSFYETNIIKEDIDTSNKRGLHIYIPA